MMEDVSDSCQWCREKSQTILFNFIYSFLQDSRKSDFMHRDSEQ